ncbi:unnamed protein product [Musa acuminata subsp. burmannicoides]
MFISCCNSTNASCASMNTVQWPSRLCSRRRNMKFHRFMLQFDHRPSCARANLQSSPKQQIASHCADVSLADSANRALLFSGSSWTRRTTWDETSAAAFVERGGWAVLPRIAIGGLTAATKRYNDDGSPGGCARREASEENGGHHFSPAPESGRRGGSVLAAPATRT